MISYPELETQLRNLPQLVALELVQDSDRTNEYLWLTRTIDHLLQWSDELSLRFERFQRTVSVTDSRSVKPAQMARSLSSLQRLVEQLTRNTLLSDAERQARATLAQALGELDQCFARGGSPKLPEPPPVAPATQPKPRSAHDTGMINLLYELEADTSLAIPAATDDSAPLPPAAPPVAPATRKPSAQEKMLQAMTRALRQRQQPTDNKDKP